MISIDKSVDQLGKINGVEREKKKDRGDDESQKNTEDATQNERKKFGRGSPSTERLRFCEYRDAVVARVRDE